MAGALAVFVVLWWAWFAFGWPPSGADRLAIALPVAAVVSAALSGPLFAWAGHERATAAAPADETPTAVVVGEIPREPPAFVDRTAIGKLADAAGSGRPAVVCAIAGLRGAGKTQVAAAYARLRIADRWGLVGWVNAESPDVLFTGLARIAEALGVADPEGDSAESARRLRDHLESRTGPGLLVFDNAVDSDMLLPFVPATGGTQLVVTSTDRAFADWGELVDVSVFTRQESVRYLAERTGLDDPPGANAVARELGDLPLALAQAAATAKRRRWTFARYLGELGRVPVEQLLGRVPGGGYPQSAAAALLLSVQTAEDASPSGLAGLVLRVVAVLSADGVGPDLLAGLAASDETGDVDAVLGLCASGSLLTWSEAGDAVIMHRLLARALREREQAAGRWRETVQAALGLIEPLVFGEDEAWSRRAEGTEYAIQIEALWDADSAAGNRDRELAERLLRARSWAVRQLVAATDLTRAIDTGTRVLADCVRVLGEDHPLTLTARNNIALAYQSAGRLGEAISLSEQNLAGLVRVLGADHPDSLTARRSLANAYTTAGRLGESIPMLEQDLADRVRVLGADHPGIMAARDSLAHAYHAAWRLGDAIPLYEQNLAGLVRVLGPDHPDIMASRGSLAHAYHEGGRLGEAISLYEQNLADSARMLGADHPDTLTAQNNIARAYQAAGRLGEAIPLYEQNLADSVRVLGSEHPATIASRNNLSDAYQSAGRLGEAISLSERSLADSMRVLGQDHPRTIASRHTFANAYTAAGRLGEAIPLYEQTVADRMRVLGANHPATLSARNDLASAYQSLAGSDAVGERSGPPDTR